LLYVFSFCFWISYLLLLNFSWILGKLWTIDVERRNMNNTSIQIPSKISKILVPLSLNPFSPKVNYPTSLNSSESPLVYDITVRKLVTSTKNWFTQIHKNSSLGINPMMKLGHLRLLTELVLNMAMRWSSVLKISAW